MAACNDAGGFSARRRRERRLRAYLRYARMSFDMALAEATHHTAGGGLSPEASGWKFWWRGQRWLPSGDWGVDLL